MKNKKMKKNTGAEEEAGEETDEGDMESREVDYMTDSSSNSELEFLVISSLSRFFCNFISLYVVPINCLHIPLPNAV